MSYTLSEATEEDIPSMVDVHQSAFVDAAAIFPVKKAGHEWLQRSLRRTSGHPGCFQIVMTEDTSLDGGSANANDGTRRVVAFALWYKLAAEKFGTGEGFASNWRRRWEPKPAEGMSEEVLDRFFGGMERQHVVATGDRAEYFLEVLATHADYRYLGLGSKLIQWGTDAADREGVEAYLDAASKAVPLYQKHGFVVQKFKDPDTKSAPMLRPAREIEN